MPKTFLFFQLLLCTLLLSCQNSPEKKRVNKIDKVTFLYGAYFDGMPITTFSIDSALNVKYRKEGKFYTGKVSQGFFDTLNLNFEYLKYEKLDTSYMGNMDDLYTEIFIIDNKQAKHIIGKGGNLPVEVMGVYRWLMSSSEFFSLKETKDSLRFETDYARFVPPPPPAPPKYIPTRENADSSTKF